MASGKKDANRVTVIMGINADDGVTPMPILLDPVTGRVKIILTQAADAGSVVHSAPLQRDDNRKTVMGGVDDNGVIRPVPIDHRNNNVMIDNL